MDRFVHSFVFYFLIVLTITTQNLTAFASVFHYSATPEEECNSIDFRNSFSLKIRNQHEVAWCFAHSAADYLQYTFKLPDQISAADIAINYSKSNWSKFSNFLVRVFKKSHRNEPNEDGLIKFAVQKILPQGYCLEKLLPSETWTFIDTNTKQRKEVEILDAVSDIFNLLNKVKKGEINNAQELPFFYSFEKIDQELFFKLLLTSKKKNVLEKIRNAACINERVPYPHNLKIKMEFKNKNIFENMNQEFENQNPVSIDFYSKILKNIDKQVNPFGSLHTVLLYGRNFDYKTNECRYLIKNSYGENCSTYDSKLKCEAGYIWIPEHTLFKSMTSQVIFH